MQEQLITFQVAKLAKEKGFNITTQVIYNDGGYKLNNGYYPDLHQEDIAAPTQTLLQRWLREVHNLFVWVFPENNGETFGWEIDESFKDKYKELPDGEYDLMDYSYKTYEEALEVGLQEALKLI